MPLPQPGERWSPLILIVSTWLLRWLTASEFTFRRLGRTSRSLCQAFARILAGQVVASPPLSKMKSLISTEPANPNSRRFRASDRQSLRRSSRPATGGDHFVRSRSYSRSTASDRPSSKSFDLASECSRHDGALSDTQVSFLAIGVWCAALVPVGDSRAAVFLVLAFATMAWRRRRAWLLVALLICSSSMASGAAWASLDPAVPESYQGQARLVSDPEATAGGVRVVAEIDGVRYDMRAWGSPAGTFVIGSWAS